MVFQQAPETFIGRKREMALFKQWLDKVDEQSILFIYDELEDPAKKGGIGKTRLLREFARPIKGDRTNTIPVMIDFFNVEDRIGTVIAERVVSELRSHYPHWSPDGFEKTLQEYRSAVREGRPDTVVILSRLSDELGNDLRFLHEHLAETNTYVLLLFDTFELIERNPIMAVLRASQTFPDVYGFARMRTVIAGRNPPDMTHQNWIGRQEKLFSVPLSPLPLEDALNYIQMQGRTFDIIGQTQEKLIALCERTEGRPILLGLVVDVLNRGEKSIDDLINISQVSFEESLVEQINTFSDPVKWATFFMAHFYHHFDLELLNRIMSSQELSEQIPSITYQELGEVLPTLSFVRHSSSSDDFVLHDEMRRLVKKYCMDKQDLDERLRRELSRVAITYCEEKIAQLQHEETRQSYIVEILFHKLVIDKDDGFAFFEMHFASAIHLSQRSFARSLFQEVQGVQARFPSEIRRILRLREAELLQVEENDKAALELYEALERDRSDQARDTILYEKANSYCSLGLLHQARETYLACLEQERTNKDKSRYAEILNSLGYIYRRQGDYSRAMYSYEESLRVNRNLDKPGEYATLLNNIGNVQRLLGKFEEALRSCKLALRIRRDLFKQEKISEQDVGLSLSTLGHIYHTLGDVLAEELCYQEAFDIFNRIGNRQAISATYNMLGRVHAVKGDLRSAFACFEQAARVSSGINREAEIVSLNQRGRVCLRQKRWQESAGYFEQAVHLSRQGGELFRLAENLGYLAEAREHLNLNWEKEVKELKSIARANDYKGLLGRVNEFLGDVYYYKGKYQDAFRQYRVTCRYMALRSPGEPLEFEKFLRKLVDLLINMPINALPGAVDALLEYWYEFEMEERYPQLPALCKEISKHMVL